MLLKNQFLIKEENIINREKFYNEMFDLGFRDNLFFKSKSHIINSKFPFLVETNKKTLTVLESITCCAVAQQNNMIIDLEEFKKLKNFEFSEWNTNTVLTII